MDMIPKDTRPGAAIRQRRRIALLMITAASAFAFGILTWLWDIVQKRGDNTAEQASVTLSTPV